MLKHNVRFLIAQTIPLGTALWISTPLVFSKTLAQNLITPDNSLETEASTVAPIAPLSLPDDFERIDGGAIRGQNLFHSFTEFNVNETGAVFFITPSADVVNIFARITGSSPSEILGILGTRQADFSISNADLFLINPNGIIFGENSTLNVGGSFTATTSNDVEFEGIGSFGITNPEPPSSLLSINPSAYFFTGSVPGDIVVQSTQTNFNNSTTRGLRVPDGQSLTLLGGNIFIDGNGTGSGLHSHGGRVNVGAVNGQGLVNLDADNGLRFADNLGLATILLTDGAVIDVRTNNSGGSVTATAQDIRLENNSLLIAGIRTGAGSQDSQAGNIILNALDTIVVTESEITNAISIGSIGAGGDIQINANSLIVEDSPLQTFNLGQGNVGNVIVNATGVVSFDRGRAFSQNGASFDIGSLPVGESGRIEITSGSLLLTNGSTVSTSTFGIGNAGEIVVDTEQEVSLDRGSAIFSSVGTRSFNQGVVGKGGNISISADRLRVNNRSGLQTPTFAQGDAGSILLSIRENILFDNFSAALTNVERTGEGQGGNISISASNIALNNGSQLAAGSRGRGNAGNILIDAEGSVSFSGGEFFLPSGAFSIVERTGSGSGGSITILANNLFVENNAQLAVGVRGQGNAGNIFIEVLSQVIFNNDGTALSTVEDSQSIGEGGSISIKSNTFLALNGSQILASTDGRGDAGDIIIQTSGSTIFDGVSRDGMRPSSANASVLSRGIGNGGNIRIFASNLRLTDGGRLIAETRNQGDAGNVEARASSIIIEGISRNSRFESGIFSGTLAGTEGSGGNIRLDTSSLQVSNGALISARTENSGSGGIIVINASGVDLINQATIEALSNSSGDAGNILLNIQGQFMANNSTISTSSLLGAGGQIGLEARNVVLIGDSDIQTFVESGAGGGGSIVITADFIIALDDSDILAFSADGRGGAIDLSRTTFFGQNANISSGSLSREELLGLDGNDRVDINATGGVEPGQITVGDSSFIENSLTNLEDTIIDTATLTAGSCIARTDNNQGRFVNTGSGGLPTRPGDGVISSYPTGNVQSLPSLEPQAVWQPGDPIVEPTGTFTLPDGRLVLTRECDSN